MRKILIGAAAPLLLLLGAAANAAPFLALASWYGPGFHGRTTANGEVYNQHGLTTAHKSLPFGTRVRVTNPRTGASTIVRVNDRGPFIGPREFDLSRGAASAVGLIGPGVATLQFEILT
jgi:rare lipoprotein A